MWYQKPEMYLGESKNVVFRDVFKLKLLAMTKAFVICKLHGNHMKTCNRYTKDK